VTASELAARIDHTVLKPEATESEIDRVVAEAVEFKFASVCVAPVWLKRVAGRLKGTGVLACTVTAFPHGTSKPTVKAIEASSSVKDGADEVDIVAHLPHLARQDVDASRAELTEIARACRAARSDVAIKVIVESAYLMTLPEDQREPVIAAACRAVRESGCDFIKTSTGFHPAGGASVEAVRLMKKYGDGIRIKASGGIRDLPTALAMLEAGADRLGLSSSVAICQSLRIAASN
jgi:deoxyribose-phosphate aldolase